LPDCLIVQPIHEAGLQVLREAGITPRLASAFDMPTVAAEVGDAVAAITRNAGFNRAALEAAPHLRVIGNHGIGTDPVDVAYATELGVPVVNNPTANVISVAEHAIGLMLAVARRMFSADQATRARDFRWKFSNPQIELTGKTLGIIGYGTIGRETARMAASAFGMRVLVYSPNAPDSALGSATRATTVEELLRASDVVSLHVKLSPETRNLLSAERLALLKPSAILINTARGAAVDEGALAEILRAGKIFGAGIDVFSTEPPPEGHPLLSAPNCVLAPHVGGSTEEALVRTATECAQQVVDVLAGRRPPNIVNPASWTHRRT
jgi:D-3-phosphoglycerate dehydrogenase / 2-oxoglutarate reductase